MSYIVLPAQSRLALKHKQHSYLAGTPFFGYRVARNRLTSALEFLYVATPKGLFDLVKNEPITAFPSTGGYYKVDDTSSGIVGDSLVPIGVTNKEFYSKIIWQQSLHAPEMLLTIFLALRICFTLVLQQTRSALLSPTHQGS